MNPQRAYFRKLIYVVAICLLLLPLYMLARPTSSDRPGGTLARLREKQGLSQARLGEIDPASETIKLATLGMRGVAANILWSKATNYKKKKDWTNFSATLNQITRLEPNFISVWKYQGWNLAYNVSAEFDDYRHRYRWVITGIDYLIRGVTYNELQPRLYKEVGWTIAHKIGRADESKQFRVMFKADDEFHKREKTPTIEERDNWLVGKKWFKEFERVVKQIGDLQGMSEVVVFSNRPMCQFNYVEGLEEDGIFGDPARRHWRLAGEGWSDFGEHPIRTTWKDENGNLVIIYLNHREEFAKEASELRSQLDSLDPGLRQRIQMERWKELSDGELGALQHTLIQDFAARDEVFPELITQLDEQQAGWREALLPKRKEILTDAQNAALDVPSRLRTDEQKGQASAAETKLYGDAYRAKEKLRVGDMEVARRLKGAQRGPAAKLAGEIEKKELTASRIGRYREIVNFEHWRRVAVIEQTDEALEARSLIYDGQQAALKALLPEASEKYKAGTARWADLLNKPEFAALKNDAALAETLVEIIDGYVGVLEKSDDLFPEDFALQDFVRARAEETPGAKMLAARESIAVADKALAGGDLDAAKKAYELGMSEWQSQLQAFPSLVLMGNREIGQEVLDAITGYSQVLDKRDELFPDDFPLLDFLHLQVDHAPELLRARLAGLKGRQLASQSKFPAAQEAYDGALAEWRKLLDTYPALVRSADKDFARELTDVLADYMKVLDLRGQKLPEKFVLQDFLQAQGLAGR